MTLKIYKMNLFWREAVIFNVRCIYKFALGVPRRKKKKSDFLFCFMFVVFDDVKLSVHEPDTKPQGERGAAANSRGKTNPPPSAHVSACELPPPHPPPPFWHALSGVLASSRDRHPPPSPPTRRLGRLREERQ